MPDIDFVRDDRGGVTVMRDGHPQSHVQLADPEVLLFEYVDHFARILATLPGGPLRVTHIGGAGLTLPRYVQHVRPGSPQIVLEPDAELTDRVRTELPLPRGHRIRVRPQLGRAGFTALATGSADVVVLDAYDEGRVPADLVTSEFAADVWRVLVPGGLFLANIADEKTHDFVGRVAASFGTAFATVVAVGTHDVLKRRRYGNLVLACADVVDTVEIQRLLARSPYPSGMKLMPRSRPFSDGDTRRSPAPPSSAAWRAT